MNRYIAFQWMGLLMLALFWLSAPVQAAGVSGDALYEAEVTVPDRSDASRQEGTRQAGQRVLTRITGERDPESQESLATLVEAMPRLVERFSIQSREDELILSVSFDAEAVDRLVRQADAPLWGRERPRALVWLAVRDGRDRDLLTEDEVREQAGSVLDAAQERGLPLLFPIMDLEDRAAVDFADIWGGFDERALEASARYGPNAILIGRVDRASGDRWEGRWTLYQPDGSVRWRGSLADREEVLGDGIHEMADRLARRFAVRGGVGSDDEVRLRIQGLGELEDYVRVERHLRGLTPVEQIRLESLQSDTAIFRIQARGGRQSLEQAIELGDRLARVDGSAATDEDQVTAGLIPVEAMPTYRVRP
ncbi:hypothetical protein J2T60_000129 [Natronospira proteinivora]|uniref:DUF2066 domain-containing protein n=1 Tax=Natronospira proteinivora TaxID=1807133 RepID=A0ABT1G4F4_9GAMM|nr:DUF2066 domain-containing protein [Natronospira proteinivora]MCP1726164.1 hypothetical protein [Natronospira proteinivora]